MSRREEIAEALNATGLVDITPHYRQSLKPFDGYVKWQTRVRADNNFGYVDTWQVWLALPQDIKASEVWLEANLTALADAFHKVLNSSTYYPAELVMPNGTSNGLIFEGSRASAN